MELSLRDLTVRRGHKTVLNRASLTAAAGEFIGLIGPNGAGKSTLMRAALGLIAADGTSSLAALSPSSRAKAAAWLPQDRHIAWPVSVETLIALGRTPYGRRPGPTDAQAVALAMARTNVAGLRKRLVTTLSGGEQARVLLARVLAQDTPILIVDEPISGLDPAHQLAAMELFAALAAEGRIIIASLHDLGLAARYCARLVMLDQGRIVADGPPLQVLEAERLTRVFGVSAYVAQTPAGLVFQAIPLMR